MVTELKILNPDEIHDMFTYSVEAVVDEMLQVFAHPDLSHQLVLVSIHASQLTHMSENVLQSICQLKYRSKVKILAMFEIST